jgi:probable phosphoglycerate mutase
MRVRTCARTFSPTEKMLQQRNATCNSRAIHFIENPVTNLTKQANPTTIILIRHGETAWNAERRLQGHIDIALNAAGERQAQALGHALRAEALDAVIASDLQRAHQTAQAVAHWHGVPVQSDAGLRERCFGAFEGMTYQEIRQHYPVEHIAWKTREVDAILPPGMRVGETFRAFYGRTMAAITGLAQQYPGQKIAMVAHGGVLECAYRAALSMPLATVRDFDVLNASINRFTFKDGVLTLTAWGDVAHLEGTVLDEVDPCAA